jgi:hypothetical protein
MLAWDLENPDFDVHHLTVLCYYLQHPGLYSPEGLEGAKQLLADFLEGGITPQKVRQRERSRMDSSKRTWKIKGTLTVRGAYRHPVLWSITAADVTAGGVDNYCDQVRAWARSVHEAIRAAQA